MRRRFFRNFLVTRAARIALAETTGGGGGGGWTGAVFVRLKLAAAATPSTVAVRYRFVGKGGDGDDGRCQAALERLQRRTEPRRRAAARPPGLPRAIRAMPASQ